MKRTTKRVTGFLAMLSPEQLRLAMAYTGPDNHGSDEFRRDARIMPKPLRTSDEHDAL